MGALHEGHATLIRAARRENDQVAVSIFVNPLQFGPNEDFSRYPRPKGDDLALCEREGVDLVFYPGPEFVESQTTRIEVSGVGDLYEGAHRPGHFNGVATIVAKLFNAILPTSAYFGLKDRQQCAVIRELVRALNFRIDLRMQATVREADGLALSSRNRYLSELERSKAPKIFEQLREIKAKLMRQPANEQEVEKILSGAKEILSVDFEIDYLDMVDELRFRPSRALESSSVLVFAGKLGKTRLIDNLSVLD